MVFGDMGPRERAILSEVREVQRGHDVRNDSLAISSSSAPYPVLKPTSPKSGKLTSCVAST